MWAKSVGTFVYEPKRPGMRKVGRNTPWWLIMDVDNGIGMYYRWWLKRKFGQAYEIQPPAWGCHITVVNDRDIIKPEFKEHWKKYDRQKVQFEYSPHLELHWRFWCLPVKCEQLVEIRNELGLDTKKHPFHITVGRLGED